MSKLKKVEIYVELDVILDTRLGTVARISDDAALEVLSKDYHTREDDVFESVDMRTYTDLYKNRNKETLALSRPSGALSHLCQLVMKLEGQAMTRPYHKGAKVVVNLFPYNDLTDEEKVEIGKAISALLLHLAPVELTYIEPKDLTPKHCKQSYSVMMMYEYNDWMNMHAEAFKSTLLPEVMLLVPAIYFEGKPTPESLESITKEAAHPMRALELLASPLIELKVLDIKHFSIVTE